MLVLAFNQRPERRYRHRFAGKALEVPEEPTFAAQTELMEKRQTEPENSVACARTQVEW